MTSSFFLTYVNPAELFPFPLDEFQQQAIAALEQDQSVVVCAPTGSGKTVIGEYAMYRALSREKRLFYTTPLKALSNQKVRDFQEKLSQLGVKNPEKAVGLITGDTVTNANAPIVVMTTEIFRNMLYETPIGQVGTSLENVETVVFDECHYISDRSRGTVWEESIIYCPPSIQLVALSATIGNPEQLTDWINQVRTGVSLKMASKLPPGQKKTCVLINSHFRPVPLHFHFSTRKGLFPLFNDKKNGVNTKLLQVKPQKGRGRLRREDCPNVLTVVQQLRERDFLPAIYVIFSRRGCEDGVRSLKEVDLVSPEEFEKIQLQLLLHFFGENPLLGQELPHQKALEPIAPAIANFLADPPGQVQELLTCLALQSEATLELWQWIARLSPMTRFEQIEPLLRGIAVHHAGVLPNWKALVESLFEQALIKVVFATATLSAGINMPARTTVISALSKRTNEGHGMLSPSEFLQIAGRAGRRGMDEAGQVITVQTPFEGAKEAAFLAQAAPEPLKSWFAPSYGMVLNLLQKHSLGEAKDLLERSFAEYLAQFALEPTKAAIAAILSQLAQWDVKLAGVQEKDIRSYEKFRGHLREEERLLRILTEQAEKQRKQELAQQISQIEPGQLLYLKGRFIKARQPKLALVVAPLPSPAPLPDFLCLAQDNRWYHVTAADIFDQCLAPPLAPLPPAPSLLPSPGKPSKGDDTTAAIAGQLDPAPYPWLPAPEVLEQKAKVEQIQNLLAQHPLAGHKNPGRLIEGFHQRRQLRDDLEKRQIEYERLQSRQSYYWQEFLDLIAILQEFEALEEFVPTPLGEAAATLRGENELWLGLALLSGKFNSLTAPQLAAALSGLITEPLRPDTWSRFPAPPAVLAALRPAKDLDLWLRGLKVEASLIWWQITLVAHYLGRTNLWEIRRSLIQKQNHYHIAIPLWLETELLGLVEQWALGMGWEELCRQTSLDEGDIVRLLRRTIDLLWQIPQVPHLSPRLKDTARQAVVLMKRFPVSG
jgi:superfamily II RNA helicase